MTGKKKNTLKYYEAVGRRRSAVARTRLYLAGSKGKITVKGMNVSKGDLVVNGRSIESYFPGEVLKRAYLMPLEITDTMKRFAISIVVKGGGRKGQLGAVVHGVSRALLLVNDEYRPLLKSAGLLTRDPRAKERRKVGTGGKARRKKQSPKR